MTTYFVTRHKGAREWAEAQGLTIDKVVTHLDPTVTGSGDLVIGTLPVNLAAEVCARGGRYLHLSIEIPAHWRGKELSADDLQQFGACLEEYRVERVSDDHSDKFSR